jgi:light-regulated signal transduction histidine kinase (bacteriophytochrome)
VVIVFRDGTERRLADQAIEMLNQQLEHRVLERTAELEAANVALASFSGSVSHDLRAPLRAVSGFSTMLCERYAHVLDVEGKRFLEIIQSKSAQMTRMIDDFIRLAGLRQAPLKVTQLDSDAMLRQVVAELAEENTAARCIVVDTLPGLEGDEGLVRQVWVNLLGNALKFTSKVEHPEIRVSADEVDGMVNFKVTDNGAGFDMAFAGRMFMPFQRMHLERDFEGHGIGLATVAGVIDRHGGRVHAEGKLGEGATFHFSLPKLHRSPATAGAALN